MTRSKPRDCAWHVDGLRLTGLAWGPEDGLPVLALHGWMDHAASFQTLAPRLVRSLGAHVVALDLSGQGLSQHRAAHATYNIWDDLPQIVAVLDQLGWRDCVLLGHSRGANIGALLTAAQPQRVRAFVALDSLVAEPTDDSIVTTLRAFLDDTAKQKARAPRRYPSRAEYIARRCLQGNDRRTAEALADRALAPADDAVVLRADPRLFASSAVKLRADDIEAILRALTCPVLNIWGTAGLKSYRPKSAALARQAPQLIAQYESIDLAGDHHFHLDPKAAGQIAESIATFLRRYNLS